MFIFIFLHYFFGSTKVAKNCSLLFRSGKIEYTH